MIEKYKDHPYSSDYSVITIAFDTLMKQNTSDFNVLRNYKGVTEEAYIQMDFERERIEEVKRYMLRLLEKDLQEKSVKD